MQAISHVLPTESFDAGDWRALAALVDESPAHFLARLSHVAADVRRRTPADASEIKQLDVLATLRELRAGELFPQVTTWRLADRTRVLLVPPDHWLLIEDSVPFRVAVKRGKEVYRAESIAACGGYVACFPPQPVPGDAELILERYASDDPAVESTLRLLAPRPNPGQLAVGGQPSAIVLLTNGRGGMARLCVNLGGITSKYDCLLGANLHPSLPVDRHVFAKRARVWVNADSFITVLNQDNLASFEAGPPARWRFLANAGDGRTVEIFLEAEMVEGRNTTLLRFWRGQDQHRFGLPESRPATLPVSLTVRVDIEDRNFHWETKRNGGAEHHFASSTRPSRGRVGFEFTPAPDRQLRVFASTGIYHHEAEWCENIAHPVEASRGMAASGDAYSPGWFELPLMVGDVVALTVTAEPGEKGQNPNSKAQSLERTTQTADLFQQQLGGAAHAFLVGRGEGKTVIAGYPWFLDWGRDTLICARGLLAAGMAEEVREILLTFARFEQNGTLPNTIHGDNVSNRDTSDAPLWFGVVWEELKASEKAGRDENGVRPLTSKAPDLYRAPVTSEGRSLAEVLRSIAVNYSRGTPNGIRMDTASGLIWSPSHFTWMDTSFPAGTPREGYPVEIQALWIRLLRHLEGIGAKPEGESWGELAARAEKSFHELFWLEQHGWFADQLIARPGVSARNATPDNALRSNMIFAVSLGLVTGERARKCVDAALHHLVVPGALRSLAPLPVSPPLPIHGNNGQLLNDPARPYWGRYEGGEDTCRKPAYHNGTAWVWTFPVFCEALAWAWDFAPEAVSAAKAYLGSVDRLMAEGCIGHLPEILDGAAPHTQRGCDAQAWSVTETLRVWRLLNSVNHPSNAR
jgi:glycogen debranching enzyme